MKHNPNNSLLAAVTVAGFAIAALLAAPSAHAAALTWDTVTGDGGAITGGSGSWNITAGNLVWNDGTTPNVIWSQTSTTDGSNTATFAGTDGATNAYVIALAAQMAAESITFNSSGYQITGGTLALMPTTATNGAITVAAGKTATINSTLRYAHNVAASVVVGSGSVLNLGGGTTASNNPQLAFSGAGTVNITAGTYASNIGSIGNATFNQTGGTYNITPGNGAGFNITSATQNVAYNLSAGTLSVNGNNTTANGVSNAYLGVGNGTSAFTSTLAVSGTGIMNVGTTPGTYGEIRIGNDTVSNGTFNVSGGTVTVGTGAVGNKIYFFKNGSSAGNTASMTQSAGIVTTNGIQFGTTTGTYDATSAANLTLSGGSLYVGDRGIIRGGGTAVESLPVTIKLQGGTLGANQNWSSPLDMQLGTATIRAQDAASNGRNITLSGILSNDSGAGTLTTTGTGTLTLSGNNTYSGGSTLGTGVALSGTVNIGHDSALGTGKIISKGALIQASGGDRVLTNAVDVDAGGFRFGGTNNLTINGVLTPVAALRTIENTTGNKTLTLVQGISNAQGVTFDGNAGNVANGSFVVSGAISGGGGVSTTSDFQNGTLTLGGSNDYTGATTVTGGTLALGASNVLPDASDVVLNGGTLLTGTGFTESAKTLSLTAASTITMGGTTGTSILTFTIDMDSGISTSRILSIWNWNGSLGGGGDDQLKVPVGGLDAVELAGINFYSDGGNTLFNGPGSEGAILLGSGELVPVPEPSALVSVAALLGTLGMQRRRAQPGQGS